MTCSCFLLSPGERCPPEEASTYDLAAATQWNYLRLEDEPPSVHVRATAVVLGAGVVATGGYALYAAIDGWFKPLMVPFVLLAAIALWYFGPASRRTGIRPLGVCR